MTTRGLDAQFVLENAGYVRELVRRLVFDPELARDVEQETWLAALKHESTLRGSPRSWLAAIARNLARRAWRTKARREERELDPPTRPSTPSPAEILERESLRREVVEAVLALDEPWRETLVLHFLEELPVSEVAQRTGVPLDTARTRIRRGLELLRNKLERRTSLHGAALSLALVEAWRIGPPPFAALAASLSSLTAGALLVSIAAKSLAAAVAVLALVAAYRYSVRPEPASPSRLAAAPSAPRELDAPRDDRAQPIVDEGSRTALPVKPPTATSPQLFATPALATVVVRTVWAPDGTPAADIGFELHASDAADFHRDATRHRTGPDGVVRIEGVPPGSVSAFGDRDAYANAVAVLGDEVELVLELQPGFQLRGRVLDAHGAPVADAEVFLWRCISTPDQGWVVAHSNARGEYSVRGMSAGVNFVSARARGRAPTAQRLIMSNEGTTIDVDLVFERPGGAVRGRVLDDSGLPLPGATVVVDAERVSRQAEFPDGAEARPPAGQRVETDSDGGFAVEGTPVGMVKVQARGVGFSLWTGAAEVPPSGSSWVEIRLSRGAKLTGVVRDEAGQPIERAEVSIVTASSLGGASRMTSDDGSFSIEGLAPGIVQLRVDHDHYGSASRTLTVVDGEPLRAELVLSKWRTLRVEIEGAPSEWAGGFVKANSKTSETSNFSHDARIDDRGVAELTQCSDHPMRVELYSPGDPFFPRAVVENVFASAGELVVRPDPARTGHVRLRGRAVDANGAPVGSARILPSLRGASIAPIETCDGETGRFEVGPYAPGEWSILAQANGFLDARAKSVELTAGATHDFGDIVLHRGGKLAVLGLRKADGVRAVLQQETGRQRALAAVDDGWISEWIPAGSYWLVTGGGVVALQAQRVEVLADETREVRIVERIVEPVRMRAPTRESGATFVEVVDGDGVSLGAFKFEGEKAIASAPLAVGRYELRVWSGVQQLGRCSLVVSDELGVETVDLLLD